MSLSARRAWIEIERLMSKKQNGNVALRKESVDRNLDAVQIVIVVVVALRKESVDRNLVGSVNRTVNVMSLSARRAWIEIFLAGETKNLS